MKKSKTSNLYDSIVIIFLLLLSVQYLVFYYVDNDILPRFLLYIFYAIAFFLPIILKSGTQIKMNNYRSVFLYWFILVLLISLFDLIGNFASAVATLAIYIQILSAFYFTKYDVDFIEKLFVRLAFIGIISALFIISVTSIDVSYAMQRGYQTEEIFYYAILFWAVIPFVILSVLRNRNVILSLFYWAFAIAIGLIIVKRMIIVDSILLSIIVIMITNVRTGRIKNLSRLLGVMAAAALLFVFLLGDIITPLYDSVFFRIETASEDISSFNRLVESENYFSSASILSIIFGKGFSGTHIGLGETALALHIGWANFILKGGIILLLLILWPFFKIIKIIKNINQVPIKVQFSVWLLLAFSIRLTYMNMHTMAPIMLIFFYCVFTIMDYKKGVINQ